MTRLLVGLVVAAVVFMIYTLIDCALFDRSRIRGLPRAVWILVILFVPLIGGVLWLVVGRGRNDPQRARPLAPDDDPAFLGQLGRDAAQEERIRRIEQELAELDDEPPSDTEPHEHPTDHRSDGDKPGRTDA
ncbi:PLD nuclease N-terminal domain-containing protein [Rathayibacter sp. YIM 133350]|uniref:PLD nuclease N-terminal domain-containing protein n=1 Tax=Rathayibacter sp. YIM 133350 TaxID=3131992 RepID=UPI00307FB6F8